MLLVKTRLGLSGIHGVGLFADERISEGTVIWRFHPSVDLRIDEDQLELLSSACREQIQKYIYREKATGKYVLCGDDARFFNHFGPGCNCLDLEGETPDCGGITVAARDIEPGEEMTCDYSMFDLDLLEGRYSI